jgi:transposase-like protein
MTKTREEAKKCPPHRFVKGGFKATRRHGLRQRYVCQLCGATSYWDDPRGILAP